MKVLITGGTGFVGAWVTRELLDQGREVVLYDIAPSWSPLDEIVGGRARDLPVVRGDVTQLHQVLRAVQEHAITHVVHLAALLTGPCNENPLQAVTVNVGGVGTLFEAARLAPIQRVVWASSGGVFGGGYDEDELIANNAKYSPKGVYAGTKVLAEVLALHYFNAFGVDNIGLRYSFMSGEGMERGLNRRIIEGLIDAPALGQVGIVPWADDRIDFLWVGDAARATRMALDAPKTTSRMFNLTGDYQRIRDVAALVEQLIPGSQHELQPGRYGFAHRFDATAAEAELGYRPTWNIERQVRERIAAVRQAHSTAEHQ